MDQDLLRELEKYASDLSLVDKYSTVGLNPDNQKRISDHIFQKIQDKGAGMRLGSDKFIVEEVDCPEVFSESVLAGEWLKGNTFLVAGDGRGIYRVPKGTSPELYHKVPLTSLHSCKGTREARWLMDQATRAGLGVRTQYVFITVRVEQPRPPVQRLPFEDIPL